MAVWEISLGVKKGHEQNIRVCLHTSCGLNNINEISINVLKYFHHLFSFLFCAYVRTCVICYLRLKPTVCRINLAASSKKQQALSISTETVGNLGAVEKCVYW